MERTFTLSDLRAQRDACLAKASQLETVIAVLEAPDLEPAPIGKFNGTPGPQSVAEVESIVAGDLAIDHGGTRKRRKRTKAERLAMSRRMKAFWAERRGAR